MDITDNEFQEKVITASNNKLVVVDFWAPWCMPCQMLKPVLEKIEQEYEGKFILAKLNVQENQTIAAQYGVQGIPSVKFFKQGKIVDEFTGALPESAVKQKIDKNI